MTLNEAIEALELARQKMGGETPLLMADGLPVLSFPLGEDGVYVCDVSDDDDGPHQGEARPSQASSLKESFAGTLELFRNKS